jgi:hypothetical protein
MNRTLQEIPSTPSILTRPIGMPMMGDMMMP